MSTKKITVIGMLCAMAIVVNLAIHIPIIPSLPFMSYDPKDIIIVIGGFIYGPSTTLIMSVIVSILELMYRGGTYIDLIMNIISTCAFAMSAAYIYKRMHTKNGAIVGLTLGVAICTVTMLIWNYIMDPIYLGMDRSLVIGMLPAIALFNVIKCGLNMALTLFLYKPVVSVLRNTNLVEKGESETSLSRDIVFLALFILLTALVLWLVFNGVL